MLRFIFRVFSQNSYCPNSGSDIVLYRFKTVVFLNPSAAELSVFPFVSNFLIHFLMLLFHAHAHKYHSWVSVMYGHEDHSHVFRHLLRAVASPAVDFLCLPNVLDGKSRMHTPQKIQISVLSSKQFRMAYDTERRLQVFTPSQMWCNYSLVTFEVNFSEFSCLFSDLTFLAAIFSFLDFLLLFHWSSMFHICTLFSEIGLVVWLCIYIWNVQKWYCFSEKIESKQNMLKEPWNYLFTFTK